MAKFYTIGHSNRSLEEFLALLQAHHIDHIVDVRTIPKSRKFPWFNSDALKESLYKKKIKYTHMPQLGGLRHTTKHSINQGWHNASFRGFADYMQMPEFFAGFKKLHQLIQKDKHVAIMCAEAVPWQCHRSLISDAAVARHIKVLHITSAKAEKPHELTPFAVVDRTTRPMQIYYPSDQKELNLDV